MIKSAKQIIKEKGLESGINNIDKKANTVCLLEFITKFFEKNPYERISPMIIYGEPSSKEDRAIAKRLNAHGFCMSNHKVVEGDNKRTEHLLYYDYDQVEFPYGQLKFLGFNVDTRHISLL